MESLRESERRLLHAERIAHVGHLDWDLETNRVSWSAEMLRILRHPEGFIPNLGDFFQMIPVPDRDRVGQWIADSLRAKRGSAIEVEIVRADGCAGTLSIVSEVVLDDEGQPVRMFGSCQDVTDSRRAQQELFARQKLESLGTLATGIAHDFNNLLGAVLAQAEFAMAESASGGSPEEQLKEIGNVAIRGSEIVRQLLVYAGKESDVPEAVDLSKAIQEMLGLLKASVSKHAVFVTDLAENLPAVIARVAQLRQIVMNLVVNASEAIGDRDGVIRVSAGRVTVDRNIAGVLPPGLAAGSYVQLEVSDTGHGISQEIQARMFDPFYSTKSAGRGLGLAVIQGIVRSLHGAIRVVSEPEKGASFQLLLPCAGAAAYDAAGTAAGMDQAPQASRMATVLVVEDEGSASDGCAEDAGEGGVCGARSRQRHGCDRVAAGYGRGD